MRSSSVTLVERGPPSFVARIDDESVSIISKPSSPKMFASCTCTLFALGLDGCRHLWALVATIDDAELVGPSVLRRDFDLVPRHPPSASFWMGAHRVLTEARALDPPSPSSRDPDGATRARVARPRRARGPSARARDRESAGLRRMAFVAGVSGAHSSSPHRRRRG